MKTNLEYLEISRKNIEIGIDEFYIFAEKSTDLENYINHIKTIKEILITIKTLKKDKNKEVQKYYKKLWEQWNDFSNCSELGCFVNACDTIRDNVKNDFELFCEITDLFLEKRDLDISTPNHWVQALLDSNSSRKKGKIGEIKLLKILNKLKFKVVKNWSDFEKTKFCVAQFSKGDFDIKNVRKKLNIKIKTKKQNKNLDLIIKFREKIFICEAKHLNTSGGEQDKQIAELLEILSLKIENSNVFYISFLDGSYSNVLLGENGKTGTKKRTQQDQIKKYIKENNQNFWLNTAGFIQLFKNLK